MFYWKQLLLIIQMHRSAQSMIVTLKILLYNNINMYNNSFKNTHFDGTHFSDTLIFTLNSDWSDIYQMLYFIVRGGYIGKDVVDDNIKWNTNIYRPD